MMGWNKDALGWAETAIEDVERDAAANRKRARAAPSVADHANLAAHLLSVGAAAMRREAQRIRDGELSDEALNDIGVVDLAMALHGSSTGASDPLPDEEARAYTDFLRRRLADWKPSPWAFDAGVKLVLEAAVKEAESGRLAATVEPVSEDTQRAIWRAGGPREASEPAVVQPIRLHVEIGSTTHECGNGTSVVVPTTRTVTAADVAAYGRPYLWALLQDGARWVGELLDRHDAHGSAPRATWARVEEWRHLAEQAAGPAATGWQDEPAGQPPYDGSPRRGGPAVVAQTPVQAKWVPPWVHLDGQSSRRGGFGHPVVALVKQVGDVWVVDEPSGPGLPIADTYDTREAAMAAADAALVSAQWALNLSGAE
jgi:hypothetical protein